VQYIQNPGDLTPGQRDWLVWAPPGPTRPAINLYHLQAEHANLVKVAAGARPLPWTVSGRPVVRPTQWVPDSFNFVGLHIDAAAPPTFEDYFSPSSAHSGQPIFRLTSEGAWQSVNPGSERPSPSESYWVRCSGVSSYSGPLGVTVNQRRSLDYGRSLTEQTLTIQNASMNARTVSVRQVPSGAPPASAASTMAGGVPLSSWVMNYPSNVGFVPLGGPLTNTIPPGGNWSLRLAVRRQDMLPPPAQATNALYQSLIEVSDGAGAFNLVPVTASGMFSPGVTATRPGLWVGTATINLVSQGGDPASCPVCPIQTNTAAPFQFRLIIHQGTNGQAHLLQHVFVGFKSGAGTNQFGTNGTGSYVLLSDPTSQSSLYDVIVRRFGSAAFGFSKPILMTPTNADFGADGTVLSNSVFLGFNDPLNPFKHLYHPDHDNWDDTYTRTNVESFDVTRSITVRFTATDPDNLALPGWGDTMVGGIYSETITGLHKNPLYIRGTFRLHLAVTTGALN
jgi:hypothetical protein